MGRAQGPWPPTAPCLLPAPMGRVSPALGSLGGQVGLAGPCARHTDGLSQNGHSRCALQTLPPQLGSGLQPSLPAAGLIRAFTPPTGHQRQRPRFYPLVAQPAAPRCPQLSPGVPSCPPVSREGQSLLTLQPALSKRPALTCAPGSGKGEGVHAGGGTVWASWVCGAPRGEGGGTRRQTPEFSPSCSSSLPWVLCTRLASMTRGAAGDPSPLWSCLRGRHEGVAWR